MNRFFTATSFALLAMATSAAAQTSNCIRVGPDMVQCYAPDGSSTNCMRMGNDMASCTTMGAAGSGTSSESDGGSALGNSVIDVVRGFSERSFRAKVGKMLANGDCTGAAQYALKKGRIELGASLRETCEKRHAGEANHGSDVEGMVAELARKTLAPRIISPQLTLISAEANERQLVATFSAQEHVPDFNDARNSLIDGTCGDPSMITIYRGGGSMRLVYLDQEGKHLGSVLVAAAECGIQ